MSESSEAALIDRADRHVAARLFGLVVVLGAGTVLVVGWGLGVDPVRRVLPGLESMKAYTAISLVGLGVAPLAAGRGRRGNKVATGAASIAVLLGVVAWVQYVLGADFGVDELLFRDPVRTGFPGRMGLNTAITFTLVGSAWLLIHRQPSRLRHGLAQLLAASGGLLALFAMLGYIFGVTSTRGIGSATQMALHTSVLCVLSSLAFLASTSYRGPLAVLWSHRAGGQLARALLLPGAVVIVAAGILAETINAIGLLPGTELELVFQSVLAIVVLATLTVLAANRVESQAAVAEQARHEAEEARARLAAANEELEDRVRDRTAALGETITALRRTNAELERFVFAASHDLKEPLRMVAAYSTRMLDAIGDDVDDRRQRYAEFVTDGVARMTATIDGVLQFSQAGSEPLSPRPVDVGDVARRLIDALGVDEGTVHVDADIPGVVADPVLLRGALRCLLSNSLKFVPADVEPRVRISGCRQGDEVVIEVRDNGIGIPPERRSEVFDIFRRLHRHEDYPGAGVGLATARRVVERHGGHIDLDAAPGGGTIARVHLPAQP